MKEVPFSPSKRRGQNFLINKNIIERIMACVPLSRDDVVLEIGPGTGLLTRALLRRAGLVIAVELDKKLFSDLKITFAHEPKLILINQDILKFDVAKTLADLNIKSKIKLIANIPYSITSSILAYLFEHIAFFEDLYVMVQKEFAFRVCADVATSDYSSFSCFAQFHAVPEILFKVAPQSFRPRPKVDSCFLRLVPREDAAAVSAQERSALFLIIRTAFSYRRKRIDNALSTIVDKTRLRPVLSSLGLEARLRPEDLSLKDYLRIARQLILFEDFPESRMRRG